MRLLALAGLILLGAAQAAGFPWERGFLDVGSSVREPLVFTWDQPELSPPSGGWERQPLQVPLGVVWSARPVSGPQATLTPGLPVRFGREQFVPVNLKTSLTVPAVVNLLAEAPARRSPATTGLRIAFPLAVNPAVPAPSPLAAGQEFLRLGGDAVYRRAGQGLPYPALTGRVLTLRRLEAGRAVFFTDGLGEVVREGDPQAGFSDLAPLVDDPALPALKGRYEGKPVWAYGGLGGVCQPAPEMSQGVEAPLREPLKVRRVLRLARPLVLNASGGFGDEVGHGADSIALTPLVFLLDSRALGPNGSFSATGAAAEQLHEQLLNGAGMTDTAACGVSFPAFLPDTWAVERVFSLTPPSAAVPAEPPADPRGLTRWQYAWLFGFPSATFGTRDELLKKSVWEYRNIPFPASVTFDAAGKVGSVEVPRLP
ncbi:hypothetical protein [Deinococcus metallilatus]|uniref:Uncharacterized protein n=1 Tax=Deinococcus metallilatus TaxID=1211322 RepID=A0ABR6MYU4_9DEIO|nr:hypothetical protein [Deinococcus metallilatus]MBB5296097.1 hypothetical protein [Deinococcus metallilatus]GMA13963.1 hypothetical protein GCM10025871_02940 [Deinococcus metallilatus]